MIVETHDALREVNKRNATEVVIYDLHGYPVVVIQEPVPGRIVVGKAGDRGFDGMLLAAGVRRMPTVVGAKLPPAPDAR